MDLWLMNGGYGSLRPSMSLPKGTLVLFHHTDFRGGTSHAPLLGSHADLTDLQASSDASTVQTYV